MMRMVADFQTVEDDGRIVLSTDDIDELLFVLPRPGSRVLLDDEDGHTCEAIVETMDENMWTLLLDWATWSRNDGPASSVSRGWRPASAPAVVARHQAAS